MPRRILLIPAYNEQNTILAVLDSASLHADLVVIVNDGSTDATPDLLRLWVTEHPGSTLLMLDKNRGKSTALLVGFSFVLELLERGAVAADDVLICIDADGQHQPEAIPAALEAMQSTGADVLVARRDLSGYPRYKVVGNWGLSLWATLLSGYHYHDVECGFRLMRIAVLASLYPYFTGRKYGCDQEIGVITARLGWRINNQFAITIPYYRHGARIGDGVTNLLMGWHAYRRVVTNRQWSMPQRKAAMLRLVAEQVRAPERSIPQAASS